MRRLGFFIAIMIGVLFATVAPAGAATPAAAAVPVLSRTAPGGPPANPGDILTASLTPGSQLTFVSGSGGPGLFCKQSVWGGQLMANPPAPGTAAIKLLNPFTISSCFDNAPTVTGVVGVTVGNLPETFTVSDVGGFPLQILPSPNPLMISVTLTTTGPPTVTCLYQAATGVVNGVAGPGPAPWRFINQPFQLVGGPLPACGTAPVSFLTAQYSPVIDTTAGSTTIFVN
jgi:hypothetical protein